MLTSDMKKVDGTIFKVRRSIIKRVLHSFGKAFKQGVVILPQFRENLRSETVALPPML
jgi:hypothetical protein